MAMQPPTTNLFRPYMGTGRRLADGSEVKGTSAPSAPPSSWSERPLPSPSFHLDGIYRLTDIIRSYGFKPVLSSRWSAALALHPSAAREGIDHLFPLEPDKWERKRDSWTWKAEVWCRFTIFAQSLILMIFNTFKQIIRGTLFLVTGVLTLNSKRLTFAFKDYISTLIQLAMIPFFGLLATFSPTRGGENAFEFAYTVNERIAREPDKILQVDDTAPSYFGNVFIQFLDNVTVASQAIAGSISEFVHHLLALNLLQASKKCCWIVASPFTPFFPGKIVRAYQGVAYD